MKQSNFTGAAELFPGSDAVRRCSFKTMNIWDSYALLAKANHQLAIKIAILRGKSALFQRKDCFECLSPHKSAA
jgi:hypothetical protein